MGAWFKAHTIGVLVGAVIVLAAIIGFTLFAMNASSKVTPVISQVTYSQSQTGTNTAPVDVVVTNAAQLRQLGDLLAKFTINPGVTDTLGTANGCVGGLTSTVAIQYSNAPSAQFSTYVCGTDNPEFSVALSKLLAGWSK